MGDNPPKISECLEKGKENLDISEWEVNMFECIITETSNEEEEEPRDPSESFINLDTATGEVELYNDQISFRDDSPVLEHKDFVIIKPHVDKKRMIALPKKNQKVNISEMLSRSFIFENEKSEHKIPEDLNLSMNYETKNMSVIGSWNVFEPHGIPNKLNSSTEVKDFSETSFLKSHSKNNKLFEDRQQEIIEMMEKEHKKIVEWKHKLSESQL